MCTGSTPWSRRESLDSTPMRPEAVLIPVKAFNEAKARLSPALSGSEREDLARTLAEAVLAACHPIPAWVVCEDDDIAAWAVSAGAEVIRSNEPGLNRVVRHGIAVLAELGFERVLVAHADLADPRSLPLLADWTGVVLVPDRRFDGTNAIIVPTNAAFSFSYGEGSFARHLSEAERLGHDMHIIDDAGLALDLDEPDDLAAFVDTDALDPDTFVIEMLQTAPTAAPSTPIER